MMIPPTRPLHLSLGLIVWSVWFVAAYGGLSVGCAIAPPDPARGALTWLNGALAVLTAVTAGWLALQAVKCWRAARSGSEVRTEQRFIVTLGTAVYATAAVATAFIGIPILGLPPCI